MALTDGQTIVLDLVRGLLLDADEMVGEMLDGLDRGATLRETLDDIEGWLIALDEQNGDNDE